MKNYMECYVTIHKKENILKMTMREGIKRTPETQKTETCVGVERERKMKVEFNKAIQPKFCYWMSI